MSALAQAREVRATLTAHLKESLINQELPVIKQIVAEALQSNSTEDDNPENNSSDKLVLESVNYMRKSLKELYDDSDFLLDDDYMGSDEFDTDDEFMDDDVFFESDDDDEDEGADDESDDDEKDLDEMDDFDDDDFLDEEFHDEFLDEEDSDEEFYDDEDEDLDEDDSEDLDMYEAVKRKRKSRTIREHSRKAKPSSANNVAYQLKESNLALNKLAILHQLTVGEGLKGRDYKKALSMLDGARSIKEARIIGKSISENLKLNRKSNSTRLKESFTPQRQQKRTTDPTYERMARLAGLTTEE